MTTKFLTPHAAQVAPGTTYADWLKRGWTDAQLIAAGYLDVDTRQVIRIEGGALFKNATTLANLLIEKNLVVRHGKLLINVPSIERVHRPAVGGYFLATLGPNFQWSPASAAWLRCELMEHFRFEKYDGRSKAWLPADCPNDLARLLIRDAELFFPHEDDIASRAPTRGGTL